MDVVIIVILCLLMLFPFWSFYMLRRNIKVRDFCLSLVDMAFNYEIRRLSEKGERTEKSAFDWFSNKYSYERFLYSFKPLKLEAWFTEEELKEINR